jgi:paraquat-inducible protein A
MRQRGRLLCCRCANTLEHATGRGVDTPLALSLATLLLLFPANLMILLQVAIAGIDCTSRLGSGVIGIWQEDWPLLAVVAGLQGVLLPFLRFGLLTAALMAVRCRVGFRRTGVMFRWAERLDIWAMPDVFLIGAVIGYSRVAARLPVHIGPGGWCLVAAAACAMLTRATLDRRKVWEMIGRSDTVAAGDTIACRSCQLVVKAGRAGTRCPRCFARLQHRRAFAVMRATALVAPGYLLYPVANYFPISIDVEFQRQHSHTIASGVEQLLAAGFWPLAAVIFTTSIAIPMLKLVGMTWLIWSVRRHAVRLLRFKTRLYRVIDEIGRWSNVDIFTIVIFLPLMRLDGVVTVQAATGAPAFLAVVVLTMLAVRVFDPRLLWDCARP